MAAEQTLEQWLEENQGEIDQAQAFSADSLPDEPAGLATVLSRAQSEYARMGFLLADAESFVLKAHAAAVMEARKNHPDLSAKEREIVAKSDKTYVQVVKLRDCLAIITRALQQKAYAIMNTRKIVGAAGMNE